MHEFRLAIPRKAWPQAGRGLRSTGGTADAIAEDAGSGSVVGAVDDVRMKGKVWFCMSAKIK